MCELSLPLFVSDFFFGLNPTNSLLEVLSPSDSVEFTRIMGRIVGIPGDIYVVYMKSPSLSEIQARSIWRSGALCVAVRAVRHSLCDTRL